MNLNTTDTKQLIINVATELFAQKGISSTSVSEIAKSVGISKGTLYYYFSSKDEIIYYIADKHLCTITNSVLNCVQSTQSNTDRDYMVSFIMKKIATIESIGKIHMYFICDAISGNQELREKLQEKYLLWRDTLNSEIIKSFKGSPRDSEALSFLIIAIVDGLIVQSILKTEKIPFENISSFLVNNWF